LNPMLHTGPAGMMFNPSFPMGLAALEHAALLQAQISAYRNDFILMFWASFPAAVAAYQASHQLGMPECNVILAQCVAYLARAPKSNALYVAYGRVQRDIQDLPAEPVPIHLRNAPTRLMKDLGYGAEYKYTPDFEHREEAAQDYLPERLRGKAYLE
ncbi:hypothetical protein EBS80_01995, partial [bacterium]|nr:hypothetical protein [bacterium]